MGRNIIFCADGTGNRGGYTPDSNIYKMYHAIDLHDPETVQIAFYDNGVGTQKSTLVRGLSGAFGFGFKSNVCDLYEYLARHYNSDDNIYMFGFSRGAATIRAFNGFIDACGLIDGRDKGNKELKSEVKLAMKAYAKKPQQREQILSKLKRHSVCPTVHFIGVWDTVSALGFPEKTDKAGTFLKVLDAVFRLAGSISDAFFPHKFYNYELTPNVTNACQALAIDDERTSFWPKVWREDSAAAKNVNVEQVWFCGMHSNVGGGYQRAGLANVSFDWMLRRISGLKFKHGVPQSAQDNANVNGRMYDSRQGLATYYRYHPREIYKLCAAAGAEVKIHASVMSRLKLRTANYAPVLLPESFKIVDNENNAYASPEVHKAHWQIFRKGIDVWVAIRKWLYGTLLELTLAVVLFAGYLWKYRPVPDNYLDTIEGSHVVDILGYLTPEYFDELIDYAVIKHPQYGIAGQAVIGSYLVFRWIARSRTTFFAENMRKLFIISPQPHPRYSKSGD